MLALVPYTVENDTTQHNENYVHLPLPLPSGTVTPRHSRRRTDTKIIQPTATGRPDLFVGNAQRRRIHQHEHFDLCHARIDGTVTSMEHRTLQGHTQRSQSAEVGCVRLAIVE